MKTNLKMMALAGVAVMAASAVWAEGSTESFMRAAIEGNMAEMQVGKLAQAKGMSQDVKNFGLTLENDHTAANVNAAKVAAEMGLEVPTRPSNAQQAKYQKLAKLSGAKFDKAFIKDMVDDHEKDVKEYQKEAVKTEDGAVAGYASSTLPVLQGHLNTAKAIKAKM